MAETLASGLTQVREALLAADLVRAVASGRRRGQEVPWRRVEMRPVDLKAGQHLQVVRYDATQAFTANHLTGDAAAQAVDELLELPFGNWHVETAGQTLQVRITKKGDALVHLGPRSGPAPTSHAHDRDKGRLLPPDDPALIALGISDRAGRVRPSRQAKYRQVEEFLRALDAALTSDLVPSDRPLRIADLGCGNAYLTFAAFRYLTTVRALDVHMVGVDVKRQALDHNREIARELGASAQMTFLQASISADALEETPDVVLALHACDTATDDALAAAVVWGTPLILAAPCCHHDIAAQLRRTAAPAPYGFLTRSGILRERFADTLTDAVRAAVLRSHDYRADVAEFVESQHTPRNTLIRAVRVNRPDGERVAEDAELVELLTTWQISPRLVELLDARAG